MAKTVIVIDSPDAAKYDASTYKPRLFKQLADSLRRLITGQCSTGSANVTVVPSAVAASGTLTCGTVAVDDTVVVAGVTLTAKASPSTAQFKSGAAATSGADLVRAINAHATLKNIVKASYTGTGECTVTALVPGAAGNLIAISSGQPSVTASGATLASGAGTVSTYSY